MVRVKLILSAISLLVALAAAVSWYFASERQFAQERHNAFFGSTKELPTSGGKQMRPEW